MPDTSVILPTPSEAVPRLWRIEQKPLDSAREGVYGFCDYAKRVIELHDPQVIVQLVDTTIHEAIHAACPDLAERAVIRAGAAATACLFALGLIVEDFPCTPATEGN